MSLFQGCTLVLDFDSLEGRHGVNAVRKLHGLIKEHGGLVHDVRQYSNTAPKEATHAVAEWDSGIFEKYKIPVVNMLWVYACIHAGEVLPARAPLYWPLSETAPESNLQSTENDGLRVSCSGFKGLDRKIVESICTSLFLTFQREFHVGGLSPTDILVVSDTNEASAKMQAAKTAGIPIVGFRWLLDSFMQWKYVSTDTPKYTQGSASDVSDIVVRVQPQEEEGEVVVICPDSVDESDESQSSSHKKFISSNRSSSSSKDDDDDDDSLSSTPTQTPSAEPDMGRIMDDASPPPPHDASVEKVRERTPLKQNPIPVVREINRNRENTKRKAEDKTPQQAEPSKREQKRGKPTHMTLSGMHSDEQEQCIKILKKFSIQFTVSHAWDPKFTHVITPALKRNEKCLCALASGSWIISPEYLHQCLAKNTTEIPEKSFEISAGDAKASIESNVPKFWRFFEQRHGKRVFEGLICALHNIRPSHNPPRETITAIISAGGGTVIPFSSSIGAKNATRKCHIIITHHSSKNMEEKEQPQSPIPSIPCITSTTLITWLIAPSRTGDDRHQVLTRALARVNQ